MTGLNPTLIAAFVTIALAAFGAWVAVRVAVASLEARVSHLEKQAEDRRVDRDLLVELRTKIEHLERWLRSVVGEGPAK